MAPEARNQPTDEREFLDAGYRYALSLTHNNHNAEDLTQQAWLTLTRRYGKVDTKAILYITIRNHFYDQCRRNKIIRFESIEVSTDHLEPSNDENNAIKIDLNVLLEYLSHREREALYLNCVEGFTTREISEHTGEPRGTILSRISRARQKLQQIAATEGMLPIYEQT